MRSTAATAARMTSPSPASPVDRSAIQDVVEPEPEHPQPDVVLGQIHQLAAVVDPGQQEVSARSMTTAHPIPGPAEVYAALWFGALLAAAGELPDPLPPQIEELARRYFEACPPDVKA
jgi:hypothetical protein